MNDGIDYNVHQLIVDLVRKRFCFGLRQLWSDEQKMFDQEKAYLLYEYKSAKDKEKLLHKWEEEMKH